MNIENTNTLKQAMELAGLQNKELLNVDEAAKFLGKSKSWLYKNLKHIEHFQPTGKLIWIERKALISFIRSNRIAPQSELQDRALKTVSGM